MPLPTTFDGALFPGLPLGIQANCPPPVVVLENTLAVAANRFPTFRFSPSICNILLDIVVSNYQGTDVISGQCNGDVGNNYYDNTIHVAAVAASVAAAAAAALQTANVNTNLIRFGLPTNKWRTVKTQIVNFAGKAKGFSSLVQIGSATPPGTTNVAHLSVSGEWAPADLSQPISAIDLLTALGINMGAGSRATLYGWQTPVFAQS